ncbi:DUF420 domain-containing protein [Halobacteriales archaeon QS_1_68_20]|nr:MAG: DUF420 domain-containing protein [Halobacteriales archaeon QS_1_68_20]
MAIAEAVREHSRANPRAVTAVVSVVGYAVVGAAFAGALPFPSLSTAGVNLFAALIAVVNTIALTSILLGWRWIRRGEVQRHRRAMLLAFGLIIVFLFLYVWKLSGGFTKEFVVPEGAPLAAFAGAVSIAYYVMLFVHVVLSIVAVPVVVHAVVLGLSYTPSELADTNHARIGRIAAASWAVSLALGVITYFLLNHVYDWVPA